MARIRVGRFWFADLIFEIAEGRAGIGIQRESRALRRGLMAVRNCEAARRADIVLPAAATAPLFRAMAL